MPVRTSRVRWNRSSTASLEVKISDETEKYYARVCISLEYFTVMPVSISRVRWNRSSAISFEGKDWNWTNQSIELSIRVIPSAGPVLPSPFIPMPLCSSNYPSGCPSVHPSIHPSIHPSTHPPTIPSVAMCQSFCPPVQATARPLGKNGCLSINISWNGSWCGPSVCSSIRLSFMFSLKTRKVVINMMMILAHLFFFIVIMQTCFSSNGRNLIQQKQQQQQHQQQH